MKKPALLLTMALLAAGLGCPSAFAGAEQSSVASFKAMQHVATGMGNPAHTLVVMDDDDTLTMMPCPDQHHAATCQYLGGPAWYSWQESLLGTPSPYRVADNPGDLLDIAALLLSMNRMSYTEADIPTVLRHLTQRGAHLLVLTARGSSNLSATDGQFSKLAAGKTDFASFIAAHALKGRKSGAPGIASPFTPDGRGIAPPRAVSYQRGVMYVAGQNKGKMLHVLLRDTDSTAIRNIVFIDDTRANVVDVDKAFRDSRRYKVEALHYTALEAHKQALTRGPEAKTFQHNARNRWQRIRDELQSQLQTPALPR